MTHQRYHELAAELGFIQRKGKYKKDGLTLSLDNSDTIWAYAPTPSGGQRRLACALLATVSEADLRKLAIQPSNERLMPNGHGPAIWLPY